MLTHGRTYYPYPFTRRIVIAAIVWLAACWSTDARAQVLFRETFGSTNAQLPTATSTADGNWTNGPTCLNGRILTNANGDSASDDGTGSTHFLFHNTASCSYSAGQAVWRTVSPITCTAEHAIRLLLLERDPEQRQRSGPDAGDHAECRGDHRQLHVFT